MNFFKKALVATAVVASFGASAAKVTPSVTQLKLSKEGIANAVPATDTGFDINVKTEALTPAASQIKIQFGAGIDLSTVVTVGTTTQGTTVGAGTSTDTDVQISFGSGSFTFDNIAVDTTTADAHFVTFDVSVGQPIAAGAAFNVAFINGHGTVGAASDAVYTATDTGTVIDSGSGAVAQEVDQFTFSVKTKFDKLKDRDNDELFLDGLTTDQLVLTATDNADNLQRAITATSYDAVLTAAFTAVDVQDLTSTTSTASVSVADKEITLAAMAVTTDGVASDVELDYDAAGASGVALTIPATGDIAVKYTITGDFTSGTYVLAAADDGGEWAIDATIINVPYFPVGYDGVQSTIQLANEGTSIVDVIVTANDKMGNQYGPVNLNELPAYSAGLPAQAVSKVSDVDIMTLLSAPAESSLSITFNVDANKGVVNGYAYTQKAGTGRTEVSTSQQRGN
jgi:hypothetical protein